MKYVVLISLLLISCSPQITDCEIEGLICEVNLEGNSLELSILTPIDITDFQILIKNCDQMKPVAIDSSKSAKIQLNCEKLKRTSFEVKYTQDKRQIIQEGKLV